MNKMNGKNNKTECHCEENLSSKKQYSTPVSNQCVNNIHTVGRKVEDCRVGVTHLLAMTRIGRSLEKIFKKIFRDDLIYFKTAEILGSKLSFCPRMTEKWRCPRMTGAWKSPRMTFPVLTLATLLSFSIINDSRACDGNDVECGQNCCAEITQGENDTLHARIYAEESGEISIRDEALAGYGFTSVDIPEGVTNIGNAALAGNRLSSVTLPDSVQNIGEIAFIEQWNHEGSEQITPVVNLPTVNNGIDLNTAFSGYPVTYGIGAGQTELTPEYVQAWTATWSDASSVAIADSVTSVFPESFAGNSTITSLTIPDTMTSIGEASFVNGGFTSVLIPDTVTSIGDWAFAGSSLNSVTIPDSVTSMGHGAFGDLPLTSLTMPDSFYLPNFFEAFVGSLGGLQSLDIPNGVTEIPGQAFRNSSLPYIKIPDAITVIGEHAFFDSQLTSVDFGNGVAEIGSGAFERCSLTSVTIPDSVTSIGEEAFKHNPDLTSVEIGNGVTEIGSHAFDECDLRSVMIPDSVTSIGLGAFANNLNLESVVFSENFIADNIGMAIFGNCKNITTITASDAVLAKILNDQYFVSNLQTINCIQKNGQQCADICANFSGTCNIQEPVYSEPNEPQITESDCYANGQVLWGGACVDEYPFAKKHFTPAEAAQWLKDEDNEITITFKK